MEDLVNAREFDMFKKQFLDPGILTEYEVLLHGQLLENNRGSLKSFKVPPKTAIVMFNMPGYNTMTMPGINFLTESEKKRLRRGNLAGRNPAKTPLRGTYYAYSVMYVSGDTVPDIRVDYNIDESLGSRGTGIFNASGTRLKNPKQETLSSIINSLGPGLYFVPSCRPLPPLSRVPSIALQLLPPQLLPLLPPQLLPFRNGEKRTRQLQKMQLGNLVARSRQRPFSPGTDMSFELYSSLDILRRSSQSNMSSYMSGRGHTGALKTESIVHAIARTIAVVLMATTYAGVPITTIAEHGVVVGTVRLPCDLFTMMVLHFLLARLYKGAVRVTQRAHKSLMSMAQRAGVYSPKYMTPLPRVSYSEIMKSMHLDPNNKNDQMRAKQRLLRKYGFNVGNSRDIERKFYIHMQRIPLSNRKRHAELNIAKRTADQNTRFAKLKSHKLL